MHLVLLKHALSHIPRHCIKYARMRVFSDSQLPVFWHILRSDNHFDLE